MTQNADFATIRGFGDEWQRFDQSELSPEEHQVLFHTYFDIFPWDSLPQEAKGFDLGCGSGRWAKLVSPRIHTLHCIDPSEALEIAKKNLAGFKNCVFHKALVDAIPLADDSMDFGYSLGVLHHVPDTQAGLSACVSKLKKGAPFLLYLYYAFDNRPMWFRYLWQISDVMRRVTARLPNRLRYAVSQLIAALVYFPLARVAKFLEKSGFGVSSFPLSAYRDCSYYVMRTDALDRFGTRLEKRFTKNQVREMMEQAGLERIVFSSHEPFWCAVGFKKNEEASFPCVD